MSKYLFIASYTAEGAKGLLEEGGSSRRAAIEEMIQGLGGSMECLYFAFGDHDVYMIADLPDAASATAASITVNATGAASVTTVPLITDEEVDAATRKAVGYRAPGT